MGKLFTSIEPSLRQWIAKQHVFFVSTAPLSGDGHVNCSPKDAASLRVLDAHTVAYLDLTGSGAETLAHLRENGRIVIMFCAFEGLPKIVRLHGRGSALMAGEAEFNALQPLFADRPGARSIIKIDVSRVSDSCGYSVPLMEYRSERDNLDRWALAKGDAGLIEYRQQNNERSIDGLPV